MKTIALLAALAATISTASAQATSTFAVATNTPTPAIAIVTAPPAVTAPYANTTCTTCLVTTIYEVTYVSVCPTAGITYVPYAITTACTGGCVINSATLPAGFQTTVLHCGVCANPGPVTVTVPMTPAAAVAVPAVTTTIYVSANCPAAVATPAATPAIVVGCPGGPYCPSSTPKNSTMILFTGAASMVSSWEGIAVAIASVVMSLLLM